MIDKLSLLGGGSKVKFGGGEMTSPIRILVNGRFTDRYKDSTIDYMKIVNDTIKTYFKELFPLLPNKYHNLKDLLMFHMLYQLQIQNFCYLNEIV